MAIKPIHVLRKLLTRATPPLDTILSGPCSTAPITVTPLTDDPAGARVVSSPASALVVGIAPAAQTVALTAFPHFMAGGYACLSHGGIENPDVHVRVGESLNVPRRIAEHLASPPAPFEHVVIVGADPVFAPLDKDATLAIQWLLHRLCEEAGRAVLHGAPPPRPLVLDRAPEVLARWSADLRPMLTATGTPVFVPAGRVFSQVEPEQDEASQAVTRGYETVLPPGLTEADGACLYELAWEHVRAFATVVGSWTVLHAGSTVDPIDRSGVQACIAAKRRHMLEHGVLQRTASGLLRVTCDTAVPSLTNALRVVTGTNEPGAHWRLVL